MNKVFNLIFLFLILALVSCQDSIEANLEDDFIIFGNFGAYCYGEGCVQFYKVESDRLLQDIEEDYHGGFHEFKHFKVLPDSLFELVKDLGDYVPQELLAEPSGQIGEADISDVGVIYFEMKEGTFHQYWSLERGDFEMPLIYVEFMSKVQEKIGLINQ